MMEKISHRKRSTKFGKKINPGMGQEVNYKEDFFSYFSYYGYHVENLFMLLVSKIKMVSE